MSLTLLLSIHFRVRFFSLGSGWSSESCKVFTKNSGPLMTISNPKDLFQDLFHWWVLSCWNSIPWTFWGFLPWAFKPAGISFCGPVGIPFSIVNNLLPQPMTCVFYNYFTCMKLFQFLILGQYSPTLSILNLTVVACYKQNLIACGKFCRFQFFTLVSCLTDARTLRDPCLY